MIKTLVPKTALKIFELTGSRRHNGATLRRYRVDKHTVRTRTADIVINSKTVTTEVIVDCSCRQVDCRHRDAIKDRLRPNTITRRKTHMMIHASLCLPKGVSHAQCV